MLVVRWLLRRLLRLLQLLLHASWFVSRKSPALFVGAALGAYITEKKWDFLWDGKLLDAWIWFGVAVVAWVTLSLTRRWWNPFVSRGGAELQVLLKVLGKSARFVADSHSHARVARQHRNDELAGNIAGYLTKAYPKIKDVRSVVYKMNQDGTQLVPHRWDGAREPSGPFIKGDGGRGDMAFEFVRSARGAKLVEDTKKADSGWQGSGEGYRSYISAPIVSTSGHHGMLTIDAQEPSALTKEDLKVAELAANLLSIAFASVKAK
jgi:hypothetical protein